MRRRWRRPIRRNRCLHTPTGLSNWKHAWTNSLPNFRGAARILRLIPIPLSSLGLTEKSASPSHLAMYHRWRNSILFDFSEFNRALSGTFEQTRPAPHTEYPGNGRIYVHSPRQALLNQWPCFSGTTRRRPRRLVNEIARWTDFTLTGNRTYALNLIADVLCSWSKYWHGDVLSPQDISSSEKNIIRRLFSHLMMGGELVSVWLQGPFTTPSTEGKGTKIQQRLIFAFPTCIHYRQKLNEERMRYSKIFF